MKIQKDFYLCDMLCDMKCDVYIYVKKNLFLNNIFFIKNKTNDNEYIIKR